MNVKKLKRNKTFSMKINLTMRSILKYSICSIFLLNFIHCTNVDDPVLLEDEDNEPPANVSDFVFQSNLNGITLAWTKPTDTDFSKILILKDTSPISDAPTTGRDYASGDSIGSSQMVDSAALSSFTDTDITAGITYFYKLFAYDVSFNYASGVQLQVDTAAPLVTISTSFLSVAEGSSAKTYMISLATDALPSSGENVVINLSTNHALLTIDPSQLTLDSSNPSKIVTVTRVNNDIDEGDNLMGVISHNLDSSTGTLYNIDSVRDTVDNTNITVIMSDDDTVGFIFTPENREMNVIEGGMENYTVKLSSEPTGDVTLNVNPATGLSAGNAASLTFTPLNWDDTQIVPIIADDNNYIGVATQLQINHDVSSADSKYSFIAPGQVSVNVIDDDGMGTIVISTNTLAFNDVDGATGGTYTLSLSHDPAPGKTVRVSLSSENSALEVSPTVVDFDGTTGRSAQTIIVKRVGDASNVVVSDVIGAISHTIAMGVSYDPDITNFANSESIVNVTINYTMLDSNHDGLIEIKDETMFSNMRHNSAGTSYKTSASGVGNSSGCPTSGCNGYELTADIDLLSLLDKNGNGKIDTTHVIVVGKIHQVIDTTKDTSWKPIRSFGGTFEGNNHTIANLWVNVANDVGLFGSTSGSVEIRNVEIISGSIYSSSAARGVFYSGGLVGRGRGTLTIINSYFSGSGGVSSFSSFSGGLVGFGSTVEITDSYFSGSGGVSSSSSSSYSGGLVGFGSTVEITDSYFSGRGGVSSSSSSSSSYSGGLVGFGTTVEITDSYFSGLGGVSSSSSTRATASHSFSYSGGLVGFGTTVEITDSYFSGGGGVSSSSDRTIPSYSGGLVGGGGFDGSLIITNSYFSGGGGVSSSSDGFSFSGGLVGSGDVNAPLTIINSYFSGVGGVSSSSFSTVVAKISSGGLVGRGDIVNITNSYFSGDGGVSSSSATSKFSNYCSSGGLVGSGNRGGTLTIINSYFSGDGGVSSSIDSTVSASYSSSGGLVGAGFASSSSSTVNITSSYFNGGGGVSSFSNSGSGAGASSGGLVGGSEFDIVNITNSYWNKNVLQSLNGGTINQSPKRVRGDVAGDASGGLTGRQLKGLSGTYPSGLPYSATEAWNLGTTSQLPAIKLCVPTVDTNTAPPTTDWTTCASYGALIKGQR